MPLLSEQLDISAETALVTQTLFTRLAEHDVRTADHSARVANYAWELVKDDANAPRELVVIGSLLHDIGKIVVDPKHLWPEDYGEPFTLGHRRQVRRHAERGYQILNAHLPQVALIAGGHHFAEGDYGINPAGNPEVMIALESVVLADRFDAMLTRKDAHHSFDRSDPGAVQKAMLERFPEAGNRIEVLMGVATATGFLSVRHEAETIIIPGLSMTSSVV